MSEGNCIGINNCRNGSVTVEKGPVFQSLESGRNYEDLIGKCPAPAFKKAAI
jgi:hypothetical protein